jgi:extradiol dioxygenase family protein
VRTVGGQLLQSHQIVTSMRNSEDVFHLAIPCADLDEAEHFYVNVLGCRCARRYDDRITLDFFGDQLVCHLAPDRVEPEARPYPRHFGITFRHRRDFEELLARLKRHGAEIIQDVSTRFAGRQEQHLTIFLRDPSNNVLEFKYYHDPAMMY